MNSFCFLFRQKTKKKKKKKRKKISNAKHGNSFFFFMVFLALFFFALRPVFKFFPWQKQQKKVKNWAPRVGLCGRSGSTYAREFMK